MFAVLDSGCRAGSRLATILLSLDVDAALSIEGVGVVGVAPAQVRLYRRVRVGWLGWFELAMTTYAATRTGLDRVGLGGVGRGEG